MKNTLTYFLLCFLITTSVFAKKETSVAGAYNTVQFIENKGQVTDQHGAVRRDIDVKIEANGVVMFVGDGEIHYQWSRPSFAKATAGEENQNSNPKNQKDLSGASVLRELPTPTEKSEVEIYRMDVKLVGANKNAQVIFEEATGYYENYYLAHTGEDGVSARGFQKVIYKDIYPNIDLVFYTARVSDASVPPPPAGDNLICLYPAGGGGEVRAGGGILASGHPPMSPFKRGSVKYDFVVHPGGNPADIKLRYEGTTDLRLVDGSLVATTPYGTITEAAPYSYTAETHGEVISAFKLSGNTLSFDVGSYTGTLVIDPVLDWATYYAGGLNSGIDNLSLTTDVFEKTYLAGSSDAAILIATTGAYQTTLAGYRDGFLAKFDEDGILLWATYFGASGGDDIFSSVATDKWGNIYAAGSCDSSSRGVGLTTNGAHQTTYGGGYGDVIMVKFNAAGQRIWGTLFGGSGSENQAAIACDIWGNIFLGGGTNSTGNIAAGNTHKTSLASNSSFDCFLVKFNSAGVRLWGTYYGGNTTLQYFPSEYISAIKCDNSGNVYAVGSTMSSNGIATVNSHQGTIISATGSGFLVKFNGSNGTRIWGTYYGGSQNDGLVSLDLDNDGYIYVAGYTRSSTNIASTNSYKPVLSGFLEGVVACFNSNGVRQWGTYFGGGNNTGTFVSGIKYSSSGYLYITGCTNVPVSLATFGAHQTSQSVQHINDYGCYMAMFSKTGQLAYCTYYTGNREWQRGEHFSLVSSGTGQYISTGNHGKIYFTAITESTSGIATPGAHRTSYSNPVQNSFIAAFIADTVVYIPQLYADTVWCPGDTVRIVYGVNQPFRAGNAFTVQLSNTTGSFVNPVNIGSRSDTTGDTIICVVPLNTPVGTGYRIRIVADSPGRTSWDNQWDIRIKALPATFSNNSNSPVCMGDSLQLYGSSVTGVSWAWVGPNNFSSSAKDTFIANVQLADSGKYILRGTLNSTGCSLKDTTTVVIKPNPDKPTAGNNSPVCEFHNLQLTISSSTSGVSYSWSGPGSYISNTQNPIITSITLLSHSGDYIGTATLNGCSSSDTTTVVILPKPSIPTAGATNSPLCQRQDLQLTALNITGASYTWYGPTAFTANIQNPIRANMQMGDAGTYYVYAAVNGCVSDTDSVVVTVNTDPFVNIFPTPGASVCQGKQVIFTAVPTNGGSTSYNWLVNGIGTGSTGNTYSTTTLNNGDAVSCTMTSTGTCATPFIDTSNAITMTVQPILAPSVTISADAGPSLFPNEPINFTAVATDAGSAPKYQWKRSGADIGGATGAVWGANANFLSDGDEICVLVTSSYACPSPDTALSNCIKLEIRVSVKEIVNNKNIKIYPNPTSGILHIEGVEAGANIELIDVLGRKCAMAQWLNGSVDVSTLVPGVYVVRVNDVVAGRVVKE